MKNCFTHYLTYCGMREYDFLNIINSKCQMNLIGIYKSPHALLCLLFSYQLNQFYHITGSI